jgi:hypothetical protein
MINQLQNIRKFHYFDGKVAQFGEAFFYDNGIGELPPGFTRGGDGPWGNAPHSTTLPAAWVASASVIRTLILSWNCCCPYKGDTTIVDPL